MAFYFLSQLICTVTSPLDWAWKTTQKWPLTCPNPSTRYKVMVILFSMSADLYCDLTIEMGLKTTPKWPLICQNPYSESKVMINSFSMSADLYSDLTIELSLKNYPKMTPHMSKSIHAVQSYGLFIFNVSWFVQWPHHWIGLEKLPQNDPSHVKIFLLGSKLWSFHFHCQLICALYNWFDFVYIVKHLQYYLPEN